MAVSLGYAKDAIAVCAFVVLIVFCLSARDLNDHRTLILCLLCVALLVDGVFTIVPRLHNTSFREAVQFFTKRRMYGANAASMGAF